MKAVLLAAGFGTRLRPLTDSVPKCLVPINGRALLDIWLENLSDAGIGPFLVNTHYLADVVARHVANSPLRRQVTLVYEEELLGTGGTLLANRDFFGGETVFFAHADNLCLCNLRSFVRAHDNRSAGTVMTMMTFTTDTPESCGIVQVDDKGVVVAFDEKAKSPRGDLANGAVYVVGPQVLEFMSSLNRPRIDFSTEVVPFFVGQMFAWHNTGVHRDIGTLANWQAAQREA